MLSHYHNYVGVSENDDGVVEVCTECKHRLVTKKGRNGSIDNKKWLKEHVRDTCQPLNKTGKVFAKYYGKRQ